MSNIKVSVEYETPTTDKFDALMKQYEAAKQLADETVTHYRPLAEAAEEAKMQAILEQIKPIKRYLIQLHEINSNITRVSVRMYTNHFVIYINKFTNCVNVRWDGESFDIDSLRAQRDNFTAGLSEDYNILGQWDKFGMYEKLEATCLEYLRIELEKRKTEADNEKARLVNITGQE